MSDNNVVTTAAAASWQIATTFAMIGIGLLQLSALSIICLIVMAVGVDLYGGWPGLFGAVINALP